MIAAATIRRIGILLALAGCGTSAPTSRPTVPAASPEADADEDGVADASDLCAADREDRDGYFDHDGCPDLDDDGDHIPDVCDACPREAEDQNHVRDDDGCPDAPRAERAMQLADHIPFAEGSAAIDPEAYEALFPLAALLRREPHIERVVVVGRAAPGEPDPEALSLARASAVRTFLAGHGVDPVRLEARGFGTVDPLPRAVPWMTTIATEVYFVVTRSDGRERFVVEGNTFVARDTTALGPAPEPPSSPLCPPAAR